MNWLKSFWANIVRLRSSILLFIVLIIAVWFLRLFPRDTFEISVAVGILKLTMAVVFAHVSRKEVFPYIDVRVALESGDTAKAVGTSILIGLYFFALIEAFSRM